MKRAPRRLPDPPPPGATRSVPEPPAPPEPPRKLKPTYRSLRLP